MATLLISGKVGVACQTFKFLGAVEIVGQFSCSCGPISGVWTLQWMFYVKKELVEDYLSVACDRML